MCDGLSARGAIDIGHLILTLDIEGREASVSYKVE